MHFDSKDRGLHLGRGSVVVTNFSTRVGEALSVRSVARANTLAVEPSNILWSQWSFLFSDLITYQGFAMSSQACEPCSRRKVRCDKQQPCSNCKRRKQDHCVYPEATPVDRIKKLESLVRSLGGDPSIEDSRPSKRARGGPSPAETQDAQDARDTTEAERGQPIMLEQNGESYYVEL